MTGNVTSRVEPSTLPEWQQARRDAIIAAAASLLEDAPYERIQIRDVAATAGVALGTLYRYFSSKDHLYAEVLIRWATPIEDDPSTQRSTTGSRVRSKIHVIIAAFERHPQFFRLQNVLRTSADPVVTNLLHSFGDRIQNVILDDFVALGQPTAGDFATMIWSILITTVATAIEEGGDIAEAHRVVDQFFDLIGPRLAAADDTSPTSSVSRS